MVIDRADTGGEPEMKKDVYMEPLDRLSREMEAVPNTLMGMTFKVLTLAVLNMRYEKIAFDPSGARHPYERVRDLIDEQRVFFRAAGDVLFIEDPSAARVPVGKQAALEGRHQELFNVIWDKYDDASYDVYVDRYVHRLKVNGLETLVAGRRALDLGCGNGNFCFALASIGAAEAVGIDFGEKSVAFAEGQRARRPEGGRVSFRVSTVYDLPFPDASFDFVIQNGVFHHLEDENRAIREACRVLKPGGWFWYYTDGEGGISYDLWDRSVHLLREVPIDLIRGVLRRLNVSVGKTAHLMDGLNAVYRHTSWDEITRRLSSLGFGEFRRLTGGFDTDFDLDRIEKDPFGREKFGEGDLRVLARKSS
jgi:ubiquinone/menaquinone biosynthesis C-methylase UbiE